MAAGGERRGASRTGSGRGARRGTSRRSGSPTERTPERPSGPAPGRGVPPSDIERPGLERDAGSATQREVEPETDEERQAPRP
jgi:hypothetical protein